MPVVRQRGLRAQRELVRGRAAQVWANADGHQNFRLDGAVLVLRVRGREIGWIAFGLGVGQLAIELGQLCQLLRRALDDPDRFTTPFDGHFFAWLQSGNIHLNCRTGSLGFFGGLKRTHERNGGCHAAHCASTAGRDQPRPFAGVDWSVTHGNPR